MQAKKRTLPAKIIYSAALIAVCVLLVENPAICRDAVADALLVCYNLIIPSLFPFMIFSQFLLASPVSGAIRRILEKPAKTVLGMTGECVSVFVLGSVAGFPVAAKCTERLYRDGAVTKNQAERLLGLANNASVAFVVSIIGGLILGNLNLGLALYIIQLIAACTASIAVMYIFPDREKNSADTGIRIVHKLDLSTVISDATMNILTVCGSIVFFTIVMRFAGIVLGRFELPFLLVNGFAELSSGVNMLGAVSPQAGFVLASAFVCWAGISIHTQVAIIVRGTGLSLTPYVTSKAIQCALGTGLAALYAYTIAPSALECVSFVTARDVVVGARLQNYYFIYLIAFLMMGAVVLFGRLVYNREKRRKG